MDRIFAATTNEELRKTQEKPFRGTVGAICIKLDDGKKKLCKDRRYEQDDFFIRETFAVRQKNNQNSFLLVSYFILATIYDEDVHSAWKKEFLT